MRKLIANKLQSKANSLGLPQDNTYFIIIAEKRNDSSIVLYFL